MGIAAEPAFLLDRKWPFRVAVGLWLGIGLGTWFVAADLDRPAQVILAALWVVGLGLLLRQFLRSLVGPVLAYDVLRVGRKPRQIWFRVAYAVALAVILTWVYLTWYSVARYRGGGHIRSADLSRLAETFFTTYMIVQFILVCVLTPAAVAGAVADEKERRTLEFLLATDLRDREILFGKLASRVGSLLLFLLAGLPVLGLMQFFGGIRPGLGDRRVRRHVRHGVDAGGAGDRGLGPLPQGPRRHRDHVPPGHRLRLALRSRFRGLAHPRGPRRPDVRLIRVHDQAGRFNVSGHRRQPVLHGPRRHVPRGVAVDLFTPLSHYLLFHAVAIALLVTWAGFNLRPIAPADVRQPAAVAVGPVPAGSQGGGGGDDRRRPSATPRAGHDRRPSASSRSCGRKCSSTPG